ncbi:MAG: DUF2442 domain-containing protein [Pyrinomonadaceae bacterium]|nr:DUF2442 domain-containing protein [Pyrinomonadaceae bacterium]
MYEIETLRVYAGRLPRRAHNLVKNFVVSVEFTDGSKREIGLEPYLRGKVFEQIRQDQTAFKAMKIDERMGTIVWGNGADIDPDVLFHNLKPAWADEKELELTK